MTARANSLTERVMATGSRATTSISVTDIRALVDALVRLGYDVDALLGTVGLRAADLGDPDVRLPCEMYGALVAGAQKQRFSPNLALEFARQTPMGAYPLLDYLVLTSDTVGAGVRQLARFFKLSGSPVSITVRDDVEPVRAEMASVVPFTFSIEYTAALMILHFRRETDGRFSAAHVSFQHTPDDAAAFERILGCPIRTMASWSGVGVAPEAWQLPLRRRDPVLRQVLEAQANDILARLPARTGVAQEVQRALASRVAGGDTQIGTVARELAMSGRTLQRRLAEEGVSYQQLLEDARKEAAGRHISESTLAIGEVAYLVGYSEPAPFHRAFKRWYGMTPEAFRQKQRRVRDGDPPSRIPR